MCTRKYLKVDCIDHGLCPATWYSLKIIVHPKCHRYDTIRQAVMNRIQRII